MQFWDCRSLFLFFSLYFSACTISPTDQSVVPPGEPYRFMGYTYGRQEAVLIHAQNPATLDWHRIDQTFSDIVPQQNPNAPEAFFWSKRISIPARYYGFNHEGRVAAHIRVTTAGGVRGEDVVLPGEAEGQGALLPGLRSHDGLGCVVHTWNEGRILEIEECFSSNHGSVIVVFDDMP